MKYSSVFKNVKITACLVGFVCFGSIYSFAQTPSLEDQGERIYGNYCMTCHGESLINSGQSFDLRKLKISEEARFQNSVQNGKNQMPPWGGVISQSDMKAIWAYIRTLANDKDSASK